MITIASEEDHDKVVEIYKNHKNIMFYTACNILKDIHLAEDAVSQAFIKIIENIHKIDEVNCNKTRGFVVIIVRNISYNILKRQTNKSAQSYEDFYEISSESEVSPQDMIISEENYKKILECIKKLNNSYADTLILHFVYDYSYKEIAQLFGISEENVRVRVFRGRQQLIRELKKEVVNDEQTEPAR